MTEPDRFGERVRAQLVERPPARRCCRLAFVSGLCRSAGALQLRSGGELAVELDLDGRAARLLFGLLREAGAECEIRSYREPRFQRRSRVAVRLLGDRALQFLHEAGVLSAGLAPLERPPRRLTGRGCCRGAYLRGAFAAAGSVSAPQAPAHLELRTHDLDAARVLAGRAATADVALATAQRRGHALAYTKRRAGVRDLLALIGAHDAALLFDEADTISATRAAANRAANCDQANLVRLGAAARRQRAVLERLDLTAVAPELEQVARLRLQHPDLSLADLGRRASPPLSKATVAGRMRSLLAFTDA